MLKLLRALRPSRRVKHPVEQEFRLHGILQDQPRQFYLCMTAIVRNESRYIRQWIEFHRLMGVEHFTIYDNASTDTTKSVLEPYAASGIVEVVPWPHFLRDYDTQAMAYAHALRHAGPRTRWLAFVDIDEYLFSPTADTLPEVLREYEDLPALVAYWAVFGTSGHTAPVEGLLIEEFTRRAPIPREPVRDPILANYKSIVQPHRVVGNRGAHNFITGVDGCNGYNELREKIWRKNPRRVTVQRLRINHYYTKSLAEWNARFGRLEGPGTIARNAFLQDAFEKVEGHAIEDREILRFVPSLRRALEDATPAVRAAYR